MASASFTETLDKLYSYDLDRIETAIRALDAEIAASEHEGDRFAAYFRGEAHGNSVRAAERKHDKAHHARIDALHDVESFCMKGDHIEAVKQANYGVGCDPADVRAALVAAREVVTEKLAQVRGTAFDCARCGDGTALRAGEACAYCGGDPE